MTATLDDSIRSSGIVTKIGEADPIDTGRKSPSPRPPDETGDIKEDPAAFRFNSSVDSASGDFHDKT